jgi:hypothetical protein
MARLQKRSRSLGSTLGVTPKEQTASKVVATYTTGICGTAL